MTRSQFAFVRRGIAPELGSTKLLSRMVGLQVASDLLMSGRFFSGVEAADIGLAARAVPSDEVLDTALGWAIDVAANTAPVSVAVTKKMIKNLLPRFKDTFRKELRLIPWLGSQPDAAERVSCTSWKSAHHHGREVCSPTCPI